jgi:ATP-binding cassette subfamily C protein LapB
MFALASPLFIMNVYDRVVPNNAMETLWVLAIGAVTVFGFDFLLRNLRGYFVDAAGKSADVILASRIFQQVLNIEMSARPQSAGAFASNLRDFETVRDFFTSATVSTFVDLPFALFFILVIWALAGPVAYVPLSALPVMILVGWFVQYPLNHAVQKVHSESAQKHGILVEAIGGLETVKSMGAEGRMQRQWERFVGSTAESSRRSRLLSSFAVNFSMFATQMVTVGTVIVGVYLIKEGEMTVGALIACVILGSRAMAPLAQLANILVRFQQSKVALSTLNKIMAMPVERPVGKVFVSRPVAEGAIEFKDVSFSYPNQKLEALSNVSFRINPGERVAIIGRIGSGKSTIGKLMVGLYQPNEGSVLMDNVDLRQMDPADVRHGIGYVPQDVFLFYGSVRDNIAMATPYADDKMVIRSAQLAGADDFIRSHPQGYDMPVGERGESLSGGQRQTIAVARALMLDPPVLVLDEPTSGMDHSSEQRLKDRLNGIMAGKTLVVVSHRASLLSLVDRVIILDGGKVVADGPRETVLQRLRDGQLRVPRK